MNTTKEKLQALSKKIKKLREESTKESKALFKEATTELFEKYPQLKSISWAQYTPYFCDGDTCEFGVGSFGLNGYDEDGAPEEDSNGAEGPSSFENLIEAGSGGVWNEAENKFEKKKPDPTARQIYDEVSEIFKLISEDDFLAMFGDHVKVIVTKKKIDIEEYSHD